MKTKITYNGKIGFEPVNRTKKHENQASWKRIAMVHFDGDICEYYAWFIKKRYNLELNKPLRGAHVSFINDSVRDLTKQGQISLDEMNKAWEETKKKWDGKVIPVTFDLEACTDDKHWWLRVSHDDRELLHGIRAEVNLDRPFFGLHMTIGHANEKFLEHSKYIHRLVKEGLIK
jgi:hypothetical protein